MDTPKWRIITEPQGRDLNRPGFEKNKGGLVIFLQPVSGTSYKQEVARVAFDRKESANPRESFEARLDKEIKKAVAACKVLNEDLMGNGELV